MQKFILILLILVLNIDLFAEETKTDKYKFGVLGIGTAISHDTKLPVIAGTDDCGIFNKSESVGLNLGLIFEMKTPVDGLWGYAKIFYDRRPFNFISDISSYSIYNEVSKKVEPVVIEHKFSGSFQYVMLALGAKYKILQDEPIYVKFDLSAGNPIISADFENVQSIKSPNGYLFPNESSSQTIAKGQVEATTSHFISTFGISYEFKLRNGLIIEPEISYAYGLNSVLSSPEWKTNMFKLGLNILMPFGKEEELPVREIPKKVIEEKPIIKEEILVEKESIVVKAAPVVLSETIVTQTYPILPYLFFNENSSEIPSKYIKNVNPREFSEKKLPMDNLSIYYNVLDIIGSRMNAYPGASVTITGSTDGVETEDAKELGLNRAENISNYLKNTWKVDPEKIRVKTSPVPLSPTSTVYKEGFEENRRAELSSQFGEILEPVIHKKFMEYKSDDSAHIHISGVKSGEKIKLTLKSDNEEILNKDFVYQSNKPINLAFINEQIQKLGRETGKKGKITGEIKNTNTNELLATFELPIQIKKNNFELGRLNLIIFDFDKSEISDFNKEIIRNFVKSSLTDKSKIYISGSTDKLGEKSYNQRLSFDRAKTVEKYLSELYPKIVASQVVGLGADQLKYDNNYPEGRFYCRTVLIEIKSPTK